LAAERPLKDIRDEYNYPKKKGIKDECSRLLEASTMKSRRGFAIQRLMNAMRQAHADGWFIVFDTLTLADRSEERFSRNAETDLVCRLLLEKKKTISSSSTYAWISSISDIVRPPCPIWMSSFCSLMLSAWIRC